jgi:phosphoglycerate dehydrogenase-like enzyme
MDPETVLVVGRPGEPLLAKLKRSATQVNLVVGDRAEDFERAAPDATVILCWSTSGDLLRQVLLTAPRVRWVHNLWAGVDHLPSAELLESRAVLTNGRGVFSQSLAEWVIGAIIYFAKDFRRLIQSQMEGRWDPYGVVEVAGQTVGIVGYGDIGRAVAGLARATGMRVLGLTRHGPPADQADGLAEQIFAPEGLISMIEQSDYLVIAAPLTPETRGMIGGAELAAMRSEAVLINVGRGPIVSEDALIRALTEKRIKGAALDVFEREPLPPGHPFYAMENVLVSPHCADRTADWLDNALQLFLGNLERYLQGESLVNVVDMGQGY